MVILIARTFFFLATASKCKTPPVPVLGAGGVVGYNSMASTSATKRPLSEARNW